MTKKEFIAKYGQEKWEKALEQIKESKRRKREEAKALKPKVEPEAPLYVTVDFNVSLPQKEEGMSAHRYREYTLERGEELAYHFQRMISFKWYRTHNKSDQCIVIVEPIIYKGEYRMRTEFYVAKITPDLKDWLINAIKSLDYE